MENEKRSDVLGFKPQKEVIYNKLLPYASALDNESLEHLKKIKANLGTAVVTREIRPGCVLWTARFMKYVKLYGLKFSKEDHIVFINLYFELLLIPDLEPWLTNKFAQVLIILLKKRELLAPEDLQIPWRPLYVLYERLLYSTLEKYGMLLFPSPDLSYGASTLRHMLSQFFNKENSVAYIRAQSKRSTETTLHVLIRSCRPYFPLSATREILDTFRPMLCPYGKHMPRVMKYLELFLPSILPPEHHTVGFRLWFDELWGIWMTCNSASWEVNVMWLFARIAHDNIGYIDWEPYIPIIFTRILRSLRLPIAYKGFCSAKVDTLDPMSVCIWIVAVMGGKSSTQLYLDQMFKALESYFHPANFGKWLLKLNDMLLKLPFLFVKRLHKERHSKPTWATPIPESHRLTEQDITNFVETMKPSVLLAVFSKLGSREPVSALNQLAVLRPEIVIPPILERLNSALDTVTEPHKLTASIQCIASVARPLVSSCKYYPEGRTNVIPLLNALLPAIDPNDIKKCMVAFQLVSTFTTLIPIVDCSSAPDYYELTPEEHQICISSAGFEDFVLEFFGRCFSLIENSSLENTRMDRESETRLNTEQSLIEVGLTSTFATLLGQASPSIYKAALDKLYSFVTGRFFEVKVSGRLAAGICRAVMKVNPKVSLALFVPHVSKMILNLTESDDVLREEHLDNELLFNLLLLAEVVRCPNKALLTHLPQIKLVLDRTLHLRCKDGYTYSGNILRNVIRSLSYISPIEHKSVPRDFSEHIKDYLPIKDWGVPGNIHDLKLEWHLPDEDEKAAVKDLVWTYMLPEIKKLESVASGELVLEKKELQSRLSILFDIIYGSEAVFPLWDEEHIKGVDTLTDLCSMPLVTSCSEFIVTMPDGSNIRKYLVLLMEKLQVKLFEIAEDDTKSLVSIVNILKALMFHGGVAKADYDSRWKTFHMIKQALSDRLIGQKRHIRPLLIDRVLLQHESRVLESAVTAITPTHQKIYHILLLFATSHYSEVRSTAQCALNHALRHFAYSYYCVLDEVLPLLKNDEGVTHEQFKGALYVVIGPKSRSMLVKRSWQTIRVLWPAVINAQNSEKPSVIKLLESIYNLIEKYFETLTLQMKVPDSCVNSARKLWDKSITSASLPEPSKQDEERGLVRLEQDNANSKNNYLELVNELLTLLETGSLHWRQYRMASSMLSLLIRYDHPTSAAVTRLFLRNINHDALLIRKNAFVALSCILKQNKPPVEKREVDPKQIALNYNRNYKSTCGPISALIAADAASMSADVPGSRPDNVWLQYNGSHLPTSAEEWNSTRFLHKEYWGYYSWPKSIKVSVPFPDQAKCDDFRSGLSESMKEIYDFFTNQENVDKFINFVSLEEVKGKDKFDVLYVTLFKGLFRCLGCLHLLPFFKPHLQKFVESEQESLQRCASEVLAGMVNSTKHQSYSDVAELWSNITPIFRLALDNVSAETLGDWTLCISTAMGHRDPNRVHWLIELLMDDPLRTDKGSFNNASRLLMLKWMIVETGWKGSELKHRMLEYLRPHLKHPFQNVREKMGTLLVYLMFDICFPGTRWRTTPDLKLFLTEVTSSMAVLAKEASDSESASTGSNTPTNSYGDGLQNGQVAKGSEGMDIDETNSKLNNLNIVDPGAALSDKEDALSLLRTVNSFMQQLLSISSAPLPTESLSIVPILCLQESNETDVEFARSCMTVLTSYAFELVLPENVVVMLDVIQQISDCSSWRARSSSLDFLQVVVFENLLIFVSNKEWIDRVVQIVLKLLEDKRVEVREKATKVLGGLLHCNFISDKQKLLVHFKSKAGKQLKRRRTSSNTMDLESLDRVIERHSGILGLCAFVNSHPYEVPTEVPDILMLLGNHLNDPQPIPTTVKTTLSNFKRTHHDNWQDHKQKFTDDQLAVLTDLLVSPSYYA